MDEKDKREKYIKLLFELNELPEAFMGLQVPPSPPFFSFAKWALVCCLYILPWSSLDGENLKHFTYFEYYRCSWEVSFVRSKLLNICIFYLIACGSVFVLCIQLNGLSAEVSC